MNKVQRPWNEISDELNERLKDSSYDANSLKSKAKISYHAARRILLGHTKNRTESALKVCTSLGISLDLPKKLQTDTGQAMIEAINDVWDGSASHAQVIIDLIKVSASFKINASGSVPGGTV